jgi:hypothetical protein
MKSLLKFNIVFLPLLAAALIGVAVTARGLMQRNAREHIAQNARLIMETATSSRTYTSNQVAPLLQHKNFKIEAAVAEFHKTIEDLPKEIDASIPKELKLTTTGKKAYTLGQQSFIAAQKQLLDEVKAKEAELLDKEFHPQSVPAFAATEIFKLLGQKFPDYLYKEATLNPTNPLDKADSWEADIVNEFRKNTQRTEIQLERQSALGPSLVLARPLKVTKPSCLECHSTWDKAPPEMIKKYGQANGFGWKLDEVIGAQVVSVPMKVPVEMADSASSSLTGWLIGAFCGVAIVGNAGALWAMRNRG